jgi:Fe-S oxidoreductase
MDTLFAPGCALAIYKPHLADRLHQLLTESVAATGRLDTCCTNRPRVQDGTQLIDVCPGCDRRFRANYPNASTVTLWELLAQSGSFPFPDYRGKQMTIIDACPTRNQPKVHADIRELLGRMNIALVEPERTGMNSVCCGDSFYGTLPVEQVREKMVQRASEMPVDDVVVYCVSCAKAMFVGGKQPHYMVDLLFGEDTLPGTCDPDEWHAQLADFVREH